jgi:NAD dependent epimerase/dehydratase family
MTTNDDMTPRQPDENEPLEQIGDELDLVDETVARITNTEVNEHLRKVLSRSGYGGLRRHILPAEARSIGQLADRSTSEIISTMRAVAPPGRQRLGEDVLAELRELTQALIGARGGAGEEHARFLAIAERGLDLPEAELADRLRDATVLVTGGTGCIGSTLMAQLAARGPGRLVSVSRGLTNDWPIHQGAEYRRADVRDRAAMDALIGEIRPDLVFHVAAQRDPGPPGSKTIGLQIGLVRPRRGW